MFRICLNINMKAVRTLETSGGICRSMLYNSQEESAFINLCVKVSSFFFFRTYTNIENEEEATEDHNDNDDDDNSNTREKHTPSPSVFASSTDPKRKRSNTSDLCETLTRFIDSRDKSYREGTIKKKQLAVFF
jgi:hypothetical protein